MGFTGWQSLKVIEVWHFGESEKSEGDTGRRGKHVSTSTPIPGICMTE